MVTAGPGAPDGRLLDPADFREVLGHFATGVAAVTGFDGDRPTGLLVNSFASVSLEPPLVSFCVAHTSATWPLLRADRLHCVCFLSADQESHARRLARSGNEKFSGLPWSPSPAGLPIPDGTLAWLECTTRAEHPAGDHVIVVSEVGTLSRTSTAATDPMIFYRGAFGRFTAAPHPSSSSRPESSGSGLPLR